MFPVEIIYITENHTVCHLCLKITDGTNIEQAIRQSDLLSQFPEALQQSFAIFGHAVSKDALLKSGDRIEILRPLKIDPMTKRRLRAQKK